MYASSVYRSAEQINSAMARVYGHMGVAVVVSMIVSFLVGNSPELMSVLFGTGLKWVVIFAPLVAILAVTFAVEKLSKGMLQLFLYGFAALMGLSFSTIFVVYNLGSIVSAFTSSSLAVR